VPAVAPVGASATAALASAAAKMVLVMSCPLLVISSPVMAGATGGIARNAGVAPHP
jgi:hypothetical protein